LVKGRDWIPRQHSCLHNWYDTSERHHDLLICQRLTVIGVSVIMTGTPAPLNLK
jgi:hypothetical protein